MSTETTTSLLTSIRAELLGARIARRHGDEQEDQNEHAEAAECFAAEADNLRVAAELFAQLDAACQAGALPEQWQEPSS